MNSGEIEDILISKENSGNLKKKKPKGILALIFIFLIILIVLVGAYWYLTKDVVSSKQLFVQNISKININKLLKNELYTNLIERTQKESSEIKSSVKFTTDLEKEELKDIDVTKFDLNISNFNDILNRKSYNEANLKYSGNEIFKFKLIAQEKEIAIASEEIMNQYIGVHYDKINEVFKKDIDIDKVKKIIVSENTNFSEKEVNEIIKKYFDVILNNIPEENFSVQENIAIENANEDVEVTNYSVKLSQTELNSVIIKLLEELKNDNDLVNKLIIDGKKENTTIESVNKNEVTETEILQTEENVEESPNENNSVEENINTNIPVIQINPVGIIGIEDGVNSGIQEILVDQNDTANEETNIEVEEKDNNEIETLETTDIEELLDKENYLKEQIVNILLGKKVNLTKQEFNTKIEELIKNVEKLTGNGLTVNIYSSSSNVEKLNIILPNDNIIDVDFLPDNNSDLNSNQSYIKLTYISENETDAKNGFSLEINKEQATANTTIDAEYSFIEKGKINKKIKLNLKTDGTINSKELKNDIVFTISTNKSETQIAIDNEIEFKEVSDIPGLNLENCIYVDNLPEQERTTILDTIKNQVTTLYTTKKDNLKFIDTNTYNQTTTVDRENKPQTTKVTREQAKDALINKVIGMMDEAVADGKELTLQDLVDLKIEGYKVSSAVTSEGALIVVDVYKFNIDSDFVLTDME